MRQVAKMESKVEKAQRVLLTIPGSTCNRSISRLVGTWIIDQWVKIAAELDLSKHNKLYRDHLADPDTRYLAGRLLEKYVQENSITLYKMEGKAGPLIKDGAPNEIYYGKKLPLPDGDSFIGERIELKASEYQFCFKTIAAPPSLPVTSPSSISHDQDTYFRPQSPNNVLFDSIMYFADKQTKQEGRPEKRTAFVLQCSCETVDDTSLDACVPFLRKLFPDTQLIYVYVHSDDIKPTVSMTSTVAALFGDRVYQMVICDLV